MAPLAVEIDGGRYAPGGGRHAGDGDREKLNVATVLGWRVLRFSTQQVEREPERVVEVIVLAYDGETRLPGWLGGSRR
jgi:very-short-patch-repair endonuclease